MPATTKRPEPDACTLLESDHRKVKKLFNQYEELTGTRSSQKRRELAMEICMELTVHAQLEEEIFYPALRAAFSESDLLDEAEVEHGTAKDLIAQIENADEVDEKFDALVKVLGEYIDHHVKEERGEIFPKARSSKVDLVQMREQLLARKEELVAEHSGAMAG